MERKPKILGVSPLIAKQMREYKEAQAQAHRIFKSSNASTIRQASLILDQLKTNLIEEIYEEGARQQFHAGVKKTPRLPAPTNA